jgi:small subunit ribosomal protein S16
VAVKIKLKRLGKIRAPYYRIVVADSRTKRDGRAIEEIGKYHPKAEPSFIEVDSERAQHWLSVGAQPTDPVRKILEVTGDWQKFKGLPGAEGTLRTAEPKADKKVAFAAAVAESLQDSGAKTKARGKVADAKASEVKAAEGKAAAKADRPARARKSDEAKKPGEAAATATAPAEAAPAAPAAARAEAAASTEAASTDAASTEAARSEADATKAAPEAPAAAGTEAAAGEAASAEAAAGADVAATADVTEPAAAADNSGAEPAGDGA